MVSIRIKQKQNEFVPTDYGYDFEPLFVLLEVWLTSFVYEVSKCCPEILDNSSQMVAHVIEQIKKAKRGCSSGVQNRSRGAPSEDPNKRLQTNAPGQESTKQLASFLETSICNLMMFLMMLSKVL